MPSEYLNLLGTIFITKHLIRDEKSTQFKKVMQYSLAMSKYLSFNTILSSPTHLEMRFYRKYAAQIISKLCGKQTSSCKEMQIYMKKVQS